VQKSYVDRNIRHKILFQKETSKEEAMEFVKCAGYFGYHPAGYGGSLAKSTDHTWVWTCYDSCD
jgi:hypothetical protein